MRSTESREQAGILLKGDKNGVRVTIREDLTLQELREEIDLLSAEAAQLLEGAEAVIDLQAREYEAEELSLLLRRFVWKTGLKVIAWVSYSVATLALLRGAGCVVGEPDQQPESTGTQPHPAAGTLYVYRSLRSGQRVEHGGDVVLLGHVNDGAEVYAGGSIVVWGRLQGVAHAGCYGNSGSSLICGSFEAPQARIADKVSYLDEGVSWWRSAVLVSLEEESFVVRFLPE
ncbi:MAG: septum site-determining protein MinC [Synergistales bacterium]|nr:septum site-determining protein MinC [Synergistales bacterium]